MGVLKRLVLCGVLAVAGLTASAVDHSAHAASYPYALGGEQAISLIKMYYKHVGEWKGTFIIKEIKALRFEWTAADKVTVHAKYQYAPAPGSSRSDSGEDQRTFSFVLENGDWTITAMGGNMSAKF